METIEKKNLSETITELNAVDNAKYSVVPSDVITLCDEENSAIVKARSLELARLDRAEFIKAFFMPAITIDKDTKASDVAKTVALAVSVTVKKVIINDNGLLVATDVVRAITISDIYKALCSTYAFGHADNKLTKDDRIKANRVIFGSNGMAICDIMAHSARKFMSVGTMSDGSENLDNKLNVNGSKEWNDLKAHFESIKSDNPFDGTMSNTKYSRQLSYALTEVCGTSINTNAHYTKALYQMLCGRGRTGLQVISEEKDVLQALAIVCRYAVNKIAMPTLDRSHIYK